MGSESFDDEYKTESDQQSNIWMIIVAGCAAAVLIGGVILLSTPGIPKRCYTNKPPKSFSEMCKALNLDPAEQIEKSSDERKKDARQAWKKLVFETHPDKGGAKEAF